MLATIRIVLTIILSIIICLFGLIYCLFNPLNPNRVSVISSWFGYMAPLFGIKVEMRCSKKLIASKKYIYISNHQNNYDMITASRAVQPHTIIVGKKSILWIPLFGQLYWLSGNLLIHRNTNLNVRNTLTKIIQKIKKYNISIWIFPEGTRSRGRGLLTFKQGAFYIAIITGIPIVPICISNTSNKIKLNRWYNGLVIIDILSPIYTNQYNYKQINILTKHCRLIMKNKLDELNAEVNKREKINR